MVQGLVTLFARITNLGWFDSKGTGEYPISMKCFATYVFITKKNRQIALCHSLLWVNEIIRYHLPIVDMNDAI